MPSSSTRPVALLTLALALVLLGVAVPYALGFAQVMRDQPLLERVQAGEARPDLSPLVLAWERAVWFFPDPRLVSDRNLLRLADARLNPATPIRTWKELQTDYETLLARRPQAPLDWARLSYVAAQAGDFDAARVAMAQSFRTGRYLPTFMLWRYTQALFLLDGMTPDQRDQVGDQTGILLRRKRVALVRMARLAPFSAKVDDLVRTYQPDATEDFLRRRGRLRHSEEDGKHTAP